MESCPGRSARIIFRAFKKSKAAAGLGVATGRNSSCLRTTTKRWSDLECGGVELWSNNAHLYCRGLRAGSRRLAGATNMMCVHKFECVASPTYSPCANEKNHPVFKNTLHLSSIPENPKNFPHCVAWADQKCACDDRPLGSGRPAERDSNRIHPSILQLARLQ